MKIDYQEQLKTFSTAETYNRTKLFFENYWLGSEEYENKWRSIQNSVFVNEAEYLPDMMFKDDFELIPLIGGNVFTSQKDYLLLQDCMHQTQDNYFVIIQNPKVVIEVYKSENNWEVHPLLRFKFPVGISWEELNSGEYLSHELIQNADKDFFVFGDSGNWGKYVANDYVNPNCSEPYTPLNIIGFRRNYSGVFEKAFKEYQLSDQENILKWLPEPYQNVNAD